MNTIRSLGRWGLPLLAFWLIMWGVWVLFGVRIPDVIMGLVALVAGVLLLLNS